MKDRGSVIYLPSRVFCIVFFLIVAFCFSQAGSSFAESKRGERVTFNFIDIELTTVTKFISDITGKNFIFDDRLKGKVTIIAPSRLSTDDAFSLFTSVLELKGYTIVPSGVDVYKIVPIGEAKQKGSLVTTGKLPVNEAYVARLISLKSISSEDAMKFLQPVVSKDGSISSFGPANMLLIVDSGLNMEKVLRIIDLVDVPAVREKPEIVLLRYANAETVVKILNDASSKGRTRSLVGQPFAVDDLRAVADQRLNAVILFGDKATRVYVKELISAIDQPATNANGGTNVIFLENADATELSKVLDGMLKGAQASRQAPPAGQGAPVSPFETVGSITITPDKATNSLIISASPSDYQNLIRIVKRLDQRRRQVYVEAMIVEASLDKTRDLGAQWRITAKKDGHPVTIGGFGTINTTDLANIATGLAGAGTIGGLGNFLNVPVTTVDSNGVNQQSNLSIPGYGALFSLSDFKDAVNVLSTPQILTADNKEAEIVVGQNVPFIVRSESVPTTTASTAIINSIDRKDIGIILKLTPQITEGDYVKLDLYEEISALVGQSDALTTTVGPTTTKRSTRTSVVVKDKETVVIGGLMQEKQETSEFKVPLLGDIPVLGWLFKSRTTTRNKTNLLVFLTPHIIKESNTLMKITDEKKKRFATAEREYAAQQLLVKFKEGVSEKAAREIISGRGATVISIVENTGDYLILLGKGQGVEDAAREFSAVPEVERAEPNYLLNTR